jgi:hypothetical protein
MSTSRKYKEFLNDLDYDYRAQGGALEYHPGDYNSKTNSLHNPWTCWRCSAARMFFYLAIGLIVLDFVLGVYFNQGGK